MFASSCTIMILRNSLRCHVSSSCLIYSSILFSVINKRAHQHPPLPLSHRYRPLWWVSWLPSQPWSSGGFQRGSFRWAMPCCCAPAVWPQPSLPPCFRVKHTRMNTHNHTVLKWALAWRRWLTCAFVANSTRTKANLFLADKLSKCWLLIEDSTILVTFRYHHGRCNCGLEEDGHQPRQCCHTHCRQLWWPHNIGNPGLDKPGPLQVPR